MLYYSSIRYELLDESLSLAILYQIGTFCLFLLIPNFRNTII